MANVFNKLDKILLSICKNLISEFIIVNVNKGKSIMLNISFVCNHLKYLKPYITVQTYQIFGGKQGFNQGNHHQIPSYQTNMSLSGMQMHTPTQQFSNQISPSNKGILQLSYFGIYLKLDIFIRLRINFKLKHLIELCPMNKELINL